METLQTKNGCLVEALKNREIDCLMHQANCFHKMGAGVAKDVAKNFPVAYFADKQSGEGELEKLGKFTKAVIDNGGIIYNLYGQYTYGRTLKQTDYYFLLGAFRTAVADAVALGYRSIGLPYKMGCVNAGGDWEWVERIVIHPIVEEYKNHQVKFTIYQKFI